MRNDWQDQDEQPKTRADYRREQERAEQDFQERDRKRVEVEKEYARTHGRSMPEDGVDDHQRISPAEQKQQRLGRQLNWTIVWLVVLIVIVYLILFLVD
ncbi:hypothetical protein [Levilactobacillus brevis]|uniref:hypothetical protein n=1 Tax=Levilactobacillus brevis TaxID=1580 RepID=UPI0021A69B63|nr:hypothetical protein [Levilactobacillus brevis]MCT3573340.1 hypothetical protein [Levilactobacillus brevis]